MPFFLYVLRSEATGRRYIGQTEDLSRRLAEHNHPDHNVAKYTSRHADPWKLVHHECWSSRAEAMRRQRWLKPSVGREWLNQLNGRASPPQAD